MGYDIFTLYTPPFLTAVRKGGGGETIRVELVFGFSKNIIGDIMICDWVRNTDVSK